MNEKISISSWDTEETKFNDWRSLTVTKLDDTRDVWSSNEINIRARFDMWYYFFTSNTGTELKIYSAIVEESLYNITSVLAKIKDSKEPCKVVDEGTLLVWDTTYEFSSICNINDIAEWINNYYD